MGASLCYAKEISSHLNALEPMWPFVHVSDSHIVRVLAASNTTRKDTHMTTTPLDPLMRRPAVQAATGMSRSGIYAAMARDFPKPVKLGPQAVAWRQSEVQAWIASREVAA